jgi:beta-glucosidase/6-phospho-beta-glucosidase/beta-galactosidase/ABC-type amino acid transport substrate-binding protein
MGCTAFRISLSWARLEPTAGSWDAGVATHYRDLLQCVRDAGMKTVVSLHHNTWPVHVQEAGRGAGMLDAAFPQRFAAYAQNVANQLGGLIDFYVTINEPDQLIYGYLKGWWMRAYPMPPGLEPFASAQTQMASVLTLIPNLFRAHARARATIKRERPDAMVGSNPLILGLPWYLRWWVDRHATRQTEAKLRAQAKRLSQAQVFALGRVDLSIAQITLTDRRMDKVLFSEPYFIAHLVVLHAPSITLPDFFSNWSGRVGVTENTAPAYQAAAFFPMAAIRTYPNTNATTAALKAGEIDVAFDDDVVLQPYAAQGFVLTPVRGNDQQFAVAMALGSRTLLNAVDLALRKFKQKGAGGASPWDAEMHAAFPSIEPGDAPDVNNRKTLANLGKASTPLPAPSRVPDMDTSLASIQKRGSLRVGIHPGVPGLCMPDAAGGYTGLEPALARYLAQQILDTPAATVEFVALDGEQRLSASCSPFAFLDPLFKTISMLTTIAGANWWNLGMAGRLPRFLCPKECVGALDFVGLDYYWGVNSFWPGRLQHLAAAMETRYAGAPVWPAGLYDLLISERKRFSDKPLLIVENGCVTVADDVLRADYISAHTREMQRAIAKGVDVLAYLCWSITSNREWGLPFDGNSDFGLYHIELDTDPSLTRTPTEASRRYADIITHGSA